MDVDQTRDSQPNMLTSIEASKLNVETSALVSQQEQRNASIERRLTL